MVTADMARKGACDRRTSSKRKKREKELEAERKKRRAGTEVRRKARRWAKGRLPDNVIVNRSGGTNYKSLAPIEKVKPEWKIDDWGKSVTDSIESIRKDGCAEFLKTHLGFTETDIKRAEAHGISGAIRMREGLEPNIINEERLARRRERGRLLREAERGK